MKNKKIKSCFNPFLLLLLFFVLAVAGCVQVPAFLAQFSGTTQVMTKGLSVTDFSAMPAQQFAGRNVRLSMTLENTGGNTTGNILACITGENFPAPSQGGYKQGFWELSPFTDNVCKRTRGLNPPNPNQQIPGGTTTVKWTVTVPLIPEGMTIIDTFTTRLFYEYSTKASLSLTAIAEAERIAMAQRGESVSTFKVEKTEGPIEIDLDIAPQPVILIDSEAFANLKITLTNTGGGAVFDTSAKDFKFADSKEMKTVAEDKMNRLVLGLIYPKDKITIVCGEPQVSGKKDQYQIELFKEKYIVSCDISIKDSTLTTKKSYPIFVFANYGYYQDASVQVSVTSRLGMPAVVPGVPPVEEVPEKIKDFITFEKSLLSIESLTVDTKDILPKFVFKDDVDGKTKNIKLTLRRGNFGVDEDHTNRVILIVEDSDEGRFVKVAGQKLDDLKPSQTYAFKGYETGSFVIKTPTLTSLSDVTLTLVGDRTVTYTGKKKAYVVYNSNEPDPTKGDKKFEITIPLQEIAFNSGEEKSITIEIPIDYYYGEGQIKKSEKEIITLKLKDWLYEKEETLSAKSDSSLKSASTTVLSNTAEYGDYEASCRIMVYDEKYDYKLEQIGGASGCEPKFYISCSKVKEESKGEGKGLFKDVTYVGNDVRETIGNELQNKISIPVKDMGAETILTANLNQHEKDCKKTATLKVSPEKKCENSPEKCGGCAYTFKLSLEGMSFSEQDVCACRTGTAQDDCWKP